MVNRLLLSFAAVLLAAVATNSEHIATHSGLPAYEKNGPRSFDIDLSWGPGAAEVKTISLSLEKSSAVPDRVPVYGMKDGQHQQVALVDTRQSTFYQDIAKHGVISITSHNGEKYHQMKGKFVHEDEEYEIEPFHPAVHKRSLGAKQGDHIIKKRKARKTGKAHTDYIMPKEGSEAYERLERIRVAYENEVDKIYNDEKVRVKREMLPSTTYTVQIYMVIDHTMYNDLEDSKGRISYPGTVEEYVLYYLGHIANEIDIRYRGIDTSQVSGVSHQWTMSTKLSYVYIATQLSEAPWIPGINNRCGKDSLDAGRTLDTLWDWAKGQTLIANVDAVMLLTRLAIYYDNDCDTIGLAYVGTVCANSRVSVNEWWDTGVYTHELGHNLGARHDKNSCSDMYVMSAFSGITSNSNRGNTWRFSDCSVRDFDRLLKSLNKGKKNCMKNDGHYIPSWADDYEPPLGTILSLDEQCKLYFGDGYKYTNDDDKICYSLNCRKNKNSGKVTKGGALQYTSCASGKWCDKEECVDVTDLPEPGPTSAPCPEKDPKKVMCDEKDKKIKCSKASKKDCKKCKNVRKMCCNRCRKKGVF